MDFKKIICLVYIFHFFTLISSFPSQTIAHGTNNANAYLNDALITSKIKKVKAHDKIVLLRGQVANKAQKTLTETIAKKVPPYLHTSVGRWMTSE